MDTYGKKKEMLYQIIRGADNPVVAYSGGVDSAVVTALCVLLHPDTVQIYSVITPYLDEADIYFGAAAALTADWPVQWMNLNPMYLESIAFNKADRCYHCKKLMLSSIKGKGEEKNGKTFFEGSNLDDLSEDRPGARAVKELGYRSPLDEAEFTKTDVRRLAAELMLPAADSPAQSCLLTRFPVNLSEAVALEDIRRIRTGEHILKAYFKDSFRLRFIDRNTCRLETSPFDAEIFRFSINTIKSQLPFAEAELSDLRYTPAEHKKKDI